MKAPTKAELYARIETLTRRVLVLEEELYGISDHVVPYTLPEAFEAGKTIMVRVPRLFSPRTDV